MKKLIIFIAFISVMVGGLEAKIWNPNRTVNPEQVVFNPDFMASSTKSLKIDRIEFYKDSTVVRFTISNPSSRTIKVDKNLVLEVNGKIISPVGINGLKFGETYRNEGWNKPTFEMIYPPITDKIERLNVLELGGTWNIYGIRMDGQQYKRLTKDEWLGQNSVYYSGRPSRFIYPERRPIVFEGYINGYDPKAFKRSFIIETHNEITGIPEYIEVPIENDGSFRVVLESYFPKFVLARYPLDMEVRFFVEPDHDIKAYYDRDIRLGQFNGTFSTRENAVVHAGDLGMVNDQVLRSMAVWTPRITRSLLSAKNLTDAKRIIDRIHREQVSSLKGYAQSFMTFPYAEKLMLAKEKAGMIYTLLEQERLFKNENRTKDGKMKPIPEGYYDFLKDELNDELVISTKYFPAIVELLNNSRFREVIGMRDAYAYPDQYSEGQKWTIAGMLKSECQALCDYLGVKTPPLWWQIKSAMTLASGGLMDANSISKEDAQWVMNELKKNNVLTEPAVFDALNKHYGLKQ